MKGIITVILLAGSSIAAYAQNNAIFYGGAGDGWGKAGYMQSSVTTQFKGGTGDGWARNGHIQTGSLTAFLGGNGDGWARSGYEQSSPATLFRGGQGDGWYSASYLQNSVHPGFYGGTGDGWNTSRYVQVSPVIAYLGGAGDGWASTYTPLSPLPVNFLSFDARRDNNASRLHWKMGVDDEVGSFDIERSANAVSFEGIGSVQQDEAKQKQYDHVDAHPLKGYNYYRLKVNLRNGKTEYTNTRVLYFDEQAQYKLKLYPNPAMDVVHVELPQDFQGMNTVVNIYNASGAIVYSQKLITNQQASITMEISSLASGNYFMHVATDNNTATAKFNISGR